MTKSYPAGLEAERNQLKVKETVLIGIPLQQGKGGQMKQCLKSPLSLTI